jgi:hypothetical protein
MKSNAFGAGSVNLKGRKTKRLRCGCCTAINFKERELRKEHKKEMRYAPVTEIGKPLQSRAAGFVGSSPT